MTLSAEWFFLQREAQLAAEQIAIGVTVLGRANHAQPGLYSQAFFGLSIGLERLCKLVIIANHAINNQGHYPDNKVLKSVHHNLETGIAHCRKIADSVNATRHYADEPDTLIHKAIITTLSDFADKTRYYNLDFITGAAGQRTDPIKTWWEKVAGPICTRHYTERQRRKDAENTALLTSLFGDNSAVLHFAEDGSMIREVQEFFGRAGTTAVVQKYGRLYTLQIIRWLATILYELSHSGAYCSRIEALLDLHDPFMIFCNDDWYLRRRKSWSIYKP